MAAPRPRLDQLNLNQLRVFAAVFETGSMTRAAQALYLTQSGISQHIKSLEDWMGQPLFDRVKQKLVPTHAGKVLHAAYVQGLGGLASAIDQIAGIEESLSGEVSLGMPVEFGSNMVAPILARLGREHPGVTFRLTLGFGSEMGEALLSGDLDFALVDDVRMDRRIEVRPMCDETVELVVAPALLQTIRKTHGLVGAKADDASLFEYLPFVEYQKDLPLLSAWYKHHYKARLPRVKVTAMVQNVRAVAALIQAGLGAGLLPSHLISQMRRDEGGKGSGGLAVIPGSAHPLRNAIGLAMLRGRTLSPAARICVDTLQRELGT